MAEPHHPPLPCPLHPAIILTSPSILTTGEKTLSTSPSQDSFTPCHICIVRDHANIKPQQGSVLDNGIINTSEGQCSGQWYQQHLRRPVLRTMVSTTPQKASVQDNGIINTLEGQCSGPWFHQHLSTALDVECMLHTERKGGGGGGVP